MNTIEITPEESNPVGAPVCNACSGPMRLTGIEPDPTQAHTDLRTFQCLICDAVQAKVMPLANDA